MKISEKQIMQLIDIAAAVGSNISINDQMREDILSFVLELKSQQSEDLREIE